MIMFEGWIHSRPYMSVTAAHRDAAVYRCCIDIQQCACMDDYAQPVLHRKL